MGTAVNAAPVAVPSSTKSQGGVRGFKTHQSNPGLEGAQQEAQEEHSADTDAVLAR